MLIEMTLLGVMTAAHQEPSPVLSSSPTPRTAPAKPVTSTILKEIPVSLPSLKDIAPVTELTPVSETSFSYPLLVDLVKNTPKK